nr:MAG TPA: ATP-binding sugar transporter [Caudoviricetes sp.]
MSINSIALKKQIVQAINEYGTDIKILRDIYEKDEHECEVLKESMKYINTIKGIIDNSSNNKDNKINNRQGVIKLNIKPTLYIPYDKNPFIQENDYLEIDGVYYRTETFTDLVHYNLLYEIPLERVELNE